jgi:hypothetical protein
MRRVLFLAVYAYLAAGCAATPKAAAPAARETIAFQVEERRTVNATIPKPRGFDRLQLHERAVYLQAVLETAPDRVTHGAVDSTVRVVRTDGYERID